MCKSKPQRCRFSVQLMKNFPSNWQKYCIYESDIEHFDNEMYYSLMESDAAQNLSLSANFRSKIEMVIPENL